MPWPRRQRLRFGDRPSRRWHLRRQPALPGLWKQLEKLQRANDVVALIAAAWRQLLNSTNNFLGRKLYEYFNWRQDTSKDLLVTFGIFSALVLAAGAVRRWAVDESTERAVGTFWADVYQVCQWVFGQEFPGPEAPLGQQVLSVGTAIIGLAAFAMVLALVEQVVLEGLEANVKRGSKVFESGHILVLGWCVSQRDMEVVRKVVQQVCVAHAPEGGTTIVVMTQRSKLEMEAMFRRCLPESKRFATSLVFRQGSPLVPSDLKLVGASKAAATIIVSDQSRSAAEADAQAVRCAILLDELDSGGGSVPSTPYLTAMAAAATNDEDELLAAQLDLSLLGRQVVVELKTANALPLLKYACSSRVLALPTSQLNAQRLAKMVKRPVISIISQQLFNFENGVSVYVHYYPHLVSTTFGDLAYLFPDGIVLGLVDRATGKTRMAPSRDCRVLSTHALVVCRPTNVSSHSYVPLAAPPSREQLRLQEALAAWNGPKSRVLYGSEWQASAALPPIASAPASSAGQRASGLVSTGRAPTSAGLSNSSSSQQPNTFVGPAWSSAVSQVELLKQQVEACSKYSDGQPSFACLEGASASLQEAASLSNNIVPAPFSASRAGTPQETLKQGTLAVAASLTQQEAHAPTQSSSSSSGSAQPVPESPMSAAFVGAGPSTGCNPSSGSSELGTVQTISPGTSAGARLSDRQTFVGALGALQTAHIANSRQEDPGCDGGGGNGAGTLSSSSSAISVPNSGKSAALQTADWPVLSGVHTHPDRRPLWQLPGLPNHQQQQQRTHLLQNDRRPFAAADGGSGTVSWPRSFAADSSVEGSAGSSSLAGPSQAAHRSGPLNDAAVLVPPEYFQVDERAEKVCVLGWGPNSLMVDLIKELDHGLSALPKGSEVVFVNMHSPHDSLGQALQHVRLENVQVHHVAANPLQRSSLAGALDVSSFRCALVLCDELWVDPDNNDANGLDSLDEPSVLRLDSLVMVAQLNMRKLLEDSKLPAINIICQKVATEGLTRFEDRHRLPLGISVNLNSFAAKMLAQIAANPLMLVPVTRLGEDAILTIVDSSSYAALGEQLNFWQVMVRCQMVGDVLLGYYEIPEHLDEPLNTVVNPVGLEARCAPRVWNQGDGRLKFILLCHKKYNHGSTSGSHDDMELENTKQAGWVAARERTPHASSHGSPHHSHHSWTEGQL